MEGSAQLAFLKYSGTPLIRLPMGQNIWAYERVTLLTSVFFTRECMAVLPGGQKSGINSEVAVRGGEWGGGGGCYCIHVHYSI